MATLVLVCFVYNGVRDNDLCFCAMFRQYRPADPGVLITSASDDGWMVSHPNLVLLITAWAACSSAVSSVALSYWRYAEVLCVVCSACPPPLALRTILGGNLPLIVSPFVRWYHCRKRNAHHLCATTLQSCFVSAGCNWLPGGELAACAVAGGELAGCELAGCELALNWLVGWLRAGWL